MGAQVVAQVVLDVAGDRDQDPAHGVLGDALAGRYGQQQQRNPVSGFAIPSGQRVDASADQIGKRGGQQATEQEGNESASVAPAVAQQVGA